MNTSTALIVKRSVFPPGGDLFLKRVAARACVLISSLLFMFAAINAQTHPSPQLADNSEIIEGVSDSTAYSVGRSLRINGTVNGAISLGGDVVVQGTVKGDVASIGGSVIQLPGSRIGGDVIVVGGKYHHGTQAPERDPASITIMYAGYEEELRNLIRNPRDLLTPRWSPAYVGFRLLVVLFWFIVSLALTAAMPGTISRGVARLQLTSLRVALIGFLGALIIGLGVPFSLHYLPTPINVLVGLMALLLILIAGVFGRVIIYAATGRWFQRKYFPVGRNSESAALLLGTTFWILLSSLPYVWPLVVAVVMVISLGLALTAPYRVGWKKSPEV